LQHLKAANADGQLCENYSAQCLAYFNLSVLGNAHNISIISDKITWDFLVNII